MSEKFVILCEPRTGSYLLTDLLGRQEAVKCHGEIFKTRRVELDPVILEKLQLQPTDIEKRNRDPLHFLDSVITLSDSPVVGFKLFTVHHQAVLDSVVSDRSFKKIFLGRNPLQSYISLCIANKTNKWVNTGDLDTGDHVPIEFNEADFLERLLYQRTFYERLLVEASRDSANPFFFLDYCDLKKPAMMRNLGRFIGVDSWVDITEPRFRKQLNRPYHEVVKNWEDVESFCERWQCSIEDNFHAFLSHFLIRLYGSAWNDASHVV